MQIRQAFFVTGDEDDCSHSLQNLIIFQLLLLKPFFWGCILFGLSTDLFEINNNISHDVILKKIVDEIFVLVKDVIDYPKVILFDLNMLVAIYF